MAAAVSNSPAHAQVYAVYIRACSPCATCRDVKQGNDNLLQIEDILLPLLLKQEYLAWLPGRDLSCDAQCTLSAQSISRPPCLVTIKATAAAACLPPDHSLTTAPRTILPHRHTPLAQHQPRTQYKPSYYLAKCFAWWMDMQLFAPYVALPAVCRSYCGAAHSQTAISCNNQHT
jgi:hypothetical protein